MHSRATTKTLCRPDVSLVVEEFRCQTHSLTNQVGANASQRRWRLRALGRGSKVVPFTEPADITAGDERDHQSITMDVTTDTGLGGIKAAVLGTQVGVSADGEQLFPKAGHARGKLHDNWLREWEFRGSYPFVGFVHPGEVYIAGTIPTEVPSHFGDASNFVQTRVLGAGEISTMHDAQVGTQRYPAVITKQWLDGCFEVMVFKPNEHGIIAPVQYPEMHKSSIFLASGENIKVPELVASLEMLRASPQSACVRIDGRSFLEHLGRASPDVSMGAPQRILVHCPKPVVPEKTADAAKWLLQENVLGLSHQKEPVKINASPPVLEHFLSGEVRCGNTSATRLERSWTVQLGPFATHTVRLEKKSMSRVMILYVDNEVLAECSSNDLGGSSAEWRCKFCFIGERSMDFMVFEETRDGWPLDSKSVITKSYPYRHTVEVVYAHRKIDNVADASMTLDDVPFDHLPFMLAEHQGAEELSIDPEALHSQFDIRIPKKLTAEDTRGLARQLGSNIVSHAGGWGAIGEAAAKRMGNVGENLSMLGASAWETISSQQAQRGELSSKTKGDVAENSSKLAASLWEIMLLHRGVLDMCQPPQDTTLVDYEIVHSEKGDVCQPPRPDTPLVDYEIVPSERRVAA